MFSGRIYNRSNNSYSLFSLLANSRNNMLSQAHIVKGRDTVSISNTAKEMAARKVSTGRHHNTNIDKSIDLQKYIDLAAKNNQSALENAGNSINVKTKNYSGTGVAFRQALTEKYSKLLSEAKTHSNPESYIYQKYYDKGSEYYEMDLNDTERRISYTYEMQMYRSGKISGVNYQDSLFRGIEVDGDVIDRDKLQFERQTVNNQINNILQQAGIDKNSIPSTCELSVDPYSYRITIEGVDEEMKASMENALNVGENGKNLFKHIYKCATQDGVNSQQITKEAKMKYEAYQQIYSFTGYKINELKEDNRTYYTSDGTDIMEIARKAIDNSETVPKDFKQQMKDWVKELVSGVSSRGWNNIPDMTLSILLSPNGLKDIKQNTIYGSDFFSDNKQWYSVM